MAAWKSSQRSDSGRTTILASIQVFYSLIQEGGYLTLIIISGSFIQEHQSCSIGQILTTTRATWSSSLPRWTTVNTIHFMFWVGEHFYWRLPARRILLSDKLQVREYRFLTWFWFSWCMSLGLLFQMQKQNARLVLDTTDLNDYLLIVLLLVYCKYH